MREELALRLKEELTNIRQNSAQSHEVRNDIATTASVSHDTIHRVEKILQSRSEVLDKARMNARRTHRKPLEFIFKARNLSELEFVAIIDFMGVSVCFLEGDVACKADNPESVL